MKRLLALVLCFCALPSFAAPHLASRSARYAGKQGYHAARAAARATCKVAAFLF